MLLERLKNGLCRNEWMWSVQPSISGMFVKANSGDVHKVWATWIVLPQKISMSRIQKVDVNKFQYRFVTLALIGLSGKTLNLFSGELCSRKLPKLCACLQQCASFTRACPLYFSCHLTASPGRAARLDRPCSIPWLFNGKTSLLNYVCHI